MVTKDPMAPTGPLIVCWLSHLSPLHWDSQWGELLAAVVLLLDLFGTHCLSVVGSGSNLDLPLVTLTYL